MFCFLINSVIYSEYCYILANINSGSLYFQAHPWFKGVEWDKLYQMKAAFIPEVNDELDTQNFEKFDEVSYLFFMLMDIQELIIFLS